MRVLVCHPGPHFSVHDVFAGWSEALKAAGQHVVDFPLQDILTFYGSVFLEVADGQFKKALAPERAQEMATDRLYASVLKVRPHVLMCISGFFLPAVLFDIVRAAGVKVVLAHTESPYEDARQAGLAEHADLNLVNDPTNLALFPPGTEYFPHAYRPSIHRPGPAHPDLVCDLGFVGTGYPSRVEFFEAMDLDDLDVVLAGNWQLLDEGSPLRKYLGHEFGDCLDNTDAADVYRSHRVGLNLYRREAASEALQQGWSMGPREVETAACQGFFLRDPRGEGDEVLDMLPTFTGPEDASEQLRWWLDHPTQREACARKAREAIQDRTFDAHAARLLRLLEEE